MVGPQIAMSVGISAPVTRSKRRTFLITRSAVVVPRPWVMRAASVLLSILIGHSHVLGPHGEPESKSGVPAVARRQRDAIARLQPIRGGYQASLLSSPWTGGSAGPVESTPRSASTCPPVGVHSARWCMEASMFQRSLVWVQNNEALVVGGAM